jgi:site-specific recombinase XerD
LGLARDGVESGCPRQNEPKKERYMPSLNDLFERFIKERIYEKNVTPKTERAHRQAWISFTKHCGHVTEADQLGKSVIFDYLEALHKTGIRPTSMNCYARSLNAFFKWLNEERYVNAEAGRELRIKKLAVPKEVIKTLPDESPSTLLNHKPKDRTERRVRMLILMILDTGIRITEAFNLRVPDVDFDNRLLRVVGKGRKERLVPFSEELRKDLNRFVYSKDQVLISYAGGSASELLQSGSRHDYGDRINASPYLGDLGWDEQRARTVATNLLNRPERIAAIKAISRRLAERDRIRGSEAVSLAREAGCC